MGRDNKGSVRWVLVLAAVWAACGGGGGGRDAGGDPGPADQGPGPDDAGALAEDLARPDAVLDEGPGPDPQGPGDPGLADDGAAADDRALSDDGPGADDVPAPPTPRCAECHVTMAQKVAGGKHGGLGDGCQTCHANGLDHQGDPANVRARMDFSIALCGTCHATHAETYLHDDGQKAGHYGGSIKTSKYLEFPFYQHLMGGHGFTKEYNEDRAHAFILRDHIEIQRKQNVVCLQCKSTPVAYFWNEPRRGQMIFSKDMAWDAAVERIRDEWSETMDYGAGCTHCHDPHATRFRLVRKAQVAAILERGTDPYSEGMNVVPKSYQDLEDRMNERGEDGKPTPAARRLAGILTCAQCHVEYTCGPGIDKDKGILRDDFPWRALADLEEYYAVKYDLIQDWKHSGTGLPGIKAQHPEAEFYWESPHHQAGVACADCHMAKGQGSTSHWLTSPLKQPGATCGRCHGQPDQKVDQTLTMQDAVWKVAKDVEAALEDTLVAIETETGTPTLPPEVLIEAKTLFMRALLWWEFTVVSENSMGVHDIAEVDVNLGVALDLALQAKGMLEP